MAKKKVKQVAVTVFYQGVGSHRRLYPGDTVSDDEVGINLDYLLRTFPERFVRVTEEAPPAASNQETETDDAEGEGENAGKGKGKGK